MLLFGFLFLPLEALYATRWSLPMGCSPHLSERRIHVWESARAASRLGAISAGSATASELIFPPHRKNSPCRQGPAAARSSNLPPPFRIARDTMERGRPERSDSSTSIRAWPAPGCRGTYTCCNCRSASNQCCWSFPGSCPRERQISWALVAMSALDGGLASCRVGLREAKLAAAACVDFTAPRSRDLGDNVCPLFVVILLFFLVLFFRLV